MGLDDSWFTEVCEECGTAFSLKLGEKLHDEQTACQHIEIYRTNTFGNLMVIDGFIMLSQRDNFLYHEMMSHPALFTHPDPRQVLIIGGGDCGTLQEVLKHSSVQSVVQVEIDERVTRLSEQFFPELCTTNNDSRTHFCFEDGIAFVNNAEAGSFDVIIVDSTDPIGPAVGLFTERFYVQCHRILGEHGVLVQQSESPLVHTEILNGMHQSMRGAGFAVTHTLNFPQPVYPTGWWSATMALKRGDVNGCRIADAEQKSFATRYYNADVHKAALAVPEFMKTPDQ